MVIEAIEAGLSHPVALTSVNQYCWKPGFNKPEVKLVTPVATWLFNIMSVYTL